MNHELFESYPVLYEKEGEACAHFKFTLLMTKDGPVQITGNELPIEAEFSSEKKLDEALDALVKDVTVKKKKKKKKKAATVTA